MGGVFLEDAQSLVSEAMKGYITPNQSLLAKIFPRSNDWETTDPIIDISCQSKGKWQVLKPRKIFVDHILRAPWVPVLFQLNPPRSPIISLLSRNSRRLIVPRCHINASAL